VVIGRMTVVPFKSSAESMTHLLGGHLDVVSASAVNLIALTKRGKVRVMAVAAAERLEAEVARSLLGDLGLLKKR
jgi:putative tricarboxylic transport membrane protein